MALYFVRHYLLSLKFGGAVTSDWGRGGLYGLMNQFLTGFQFIANKQFSMEKRLGTSVCADISKHPPIRSICIGKITWHLYFEWNFCCLVSLKKNQIWLQKINFLTNIEIMFFFFNPMIKCFTSCSHVCFVLEKHFSWKCRKTNK